MQTTSHKRKPSGDRKVEILETALKLAFELGPDMVSTGKIAERLGLSQPVIYKHFSNKDAIWQGIAADLAARIKANVAQAQAGGQNPIDRLHMQMSGHLDLVEHAPALPNIMVHQDLLKPDHGTLNPIRQAMRQFHAGLILQVSAAQRLGYFAPEINAADAATLILGVAQSLVLRMMVTRDSTHLVADGRRLLDLLLTGFARRQTPGGE
jgi:AcrR family transcriptional regulator